MRRRKRFPKPRVGRYGTLAGLEAGYPARRNYGLISAPNSWAILPPIPKAFLPYLPLFPLPMRAPVLQHLGVVGSLKL